MGTGASLRWDLLDDCWMDFAVPLCMLRRLRLLEVEKETAPKSSSTTIVDEPPFLTSWFLVPCAWFLFLVACPFLFFLFVRVPFPFSLSFF